MGSLWMNPRRPEWSDVEWQMRNWLYFTWLSGDHIVEQHVHNLDVVNWALRAHPLRARGTGGRQVRTDPAFGHVFDHHSVQFEYPGGTWLFSEQQPAVHRLVDLDSLGWPSLEVTDQGLTVAATCRIAELLALDTPSDWTAAPLFAQCAHAFLMSFKIYNAATVGGNICMSLPAGAYRVRLTNPNSNRSVVLDATVVANALSRCETQIDSIDASRYVDALGLGR